MDILVYANIIKGDKRLVGKLSLDPRALPDDTFYSIVLITKPDGYCKHAPVAASLIDDYDLAHGLGQAYGPGCEWLLKLTESR